MTACFKLKRALQPKEQHPAGTLCGPCVYFSKNLDLMKLQSDEPPARQGGCGLGFVPGDEGCNELRTDSCSTRKR